MLLHRYFGDFANATLREGRLRLATPSSLNDPFEFAYRLGGELTMAGALRDLSQRLQDPKFRKRLTEANPEIVDAKSLRAYIRNNRKHMAQRAIKGYYNGSIFNDEYVSGAIDTTFRLCCFSDNDIEPCNEILLWSHYSNKHFGTRILFDIDRLIQPHNNGRSLTLREVSYGPKRVEIDLTLGEKTPGLNEKITASLGHKAPSWAYEKEYRLIVKKAHCEWGTDGTGSDAAFLPFPPAAVRRVDFGINCPPHTINQILTTVGGLYPHIACRKGTRHPTEFRVIYDSIR